MTLSFLSTDHKLKTGTNTKKALQAVYSMMSWEGNSPPEGWNRTRHVIILMTDGQKGPLLPDSRPPEPCAASGPHLTVTCGGGPEPHWASTTSIFSVTLHKEGLPMICHSHFLPHLLNRPHVTMSSQFIFLDPLPGLPPHGPSVP